MGSVAGSPNRCSWATSPARPVAECTAVNCARTPPRSSTTHTACSALAQSNPTNIRISSTLPSTGVWSPRLGGQAGRSLAGALAEGSPGRNILWPVATSQLHRRRGSHAGRRAASERGGRRRSRGAIALSLGHGRSEVQATRGGYCNERAPELAPVLPHHHAPGGGALHLHARQ